MIFWLSILWCTFYGWVESGDMSCQDDPALYLNLHTNKQNKPPLNHFTDWYGILIVSMQSYSREPKILLNLYLTFAIYSNSQYFIKRSAMIETYLPIPEPWEIGTNGRKISKNRDIPESPIHYYRVQTDSCKNRDTWSNPSFFTFFLGSK